jgi:hypothetical protein
MSFLRRPGIALIVLLILTIYGFEAHARRRAIPLPATMGDQSAYLTHARQLYESNYTVVEDRNRMPVFPFLLSLIYRPGLSETEFLTRAQTFNVNLSIGLLLLLFLIFRRFFPPLYAIVLLAATAFGVFLYRAINVQTEVLFYFVSFCAFVLLLQMLIVPRWWLAALSGATLGLAHLTKASVLPAFILWITVSVMQILWSFKAQPKEPSLSPWRRVGMFLIVIATFLAVVFPYIQTSKRIYGQYFYNVNSTFVMWCDSGWEGFEFLNAYGYQGAWRALPPEQLPSLSKYWREHSVAQIGQRLLHGSLDLLTQNALAIGYYKFVLAFVVAGAVLWARQSRRVRHLLAERGFAAAFCVLFFIGYFFLYAWYDAIVNDSKFVLSIFLPFIFVASIVVLRLGRDRVVTLAGRPMRFEQFFANVLLCLVLIDVLHNSAWFVA